MSREEQGQGQGHGSSTRGQGQISRPSRQESFPLEPYFIPGAYGDPYTPLVIPPPTYDSIYPETSYANPTPSVDIPGTPLPPYPGTPQGGVSPHRPTHGQDGNPPAYQAEFEPLLPPYPRTPNTHIPSYAAAVTSNISVHPLSRRLSMPTKPRPISPPDDDSADSSSLSELTLPSPEENQHARRAGRIGQSESRPLPTAVQNLIRVGILFSIGLLIIGGLGLTYGTLARLIGAALWSGIIALVSISACHDARHRYHSNWKIVHAIFNIMALVAVMFFIAWYGFGLAVGISYYRTCQFEESVISNCTIPYNKDFLAPRPKTFGYLRARLFLHGFGIFIALIITCIIIAIWQLTKHISATVRPIGQRLLNV